MARSGVQIPRSRPLQSMPLYSRRYHLGEARTAPREMADETGKRGTNEDALATCQLSQGPSASTCTSSNAPQSESLPLVACRLTTAPCPARRECAQGCFSLSARLCSACACFPVNRLRACHDHVSPRRPRKRCTKLDRRRVVAWLARIPPLTPPTGVSAAACSLSLHRHRVRLPRLRALFAPQAFAALRPPA